MAAAFRSFLLFSLFALYRCDSCDDYTFDYYPFYHFGPKSAWMNDPNGLCFFNNEHHLFYQYNPYNTSVPGIAHWGHAKSDDLVHWKQLSIAMFPDKWYDKNGVFSGSGFVENDIMYLYYTGNVNHKNQTPDHEQYQLLTTSTDGKTFTKFDKNPIIYAPEFQPNIRDPKVWKHKDIYYMVLGNSFENDTLGRVLLYTSKDKFNWKQASVLAQSNGSLGYMWECPDFFELDGKFVLLMSPQGVEPQGDKYKNLYQCGYLVGNFDYETLEFVVTEDFKEIDHGHDFYATQTTLTEDGSRVMFAWSDTWDQNYPEGKDGFTGQLTLPRTLNLTEDGLILQQPIEAIKKAVGKILYTGKGRSGRQVKLKNNVGMVKICTACDKDFTLLIESQYANDTVKIRYERDGHVVLDRGGNDSMRRTEFCPDSDFQMLIFVDRSSIEVFFGKGEVVMSSRFFPRGTVTIRIAKNSYASSFIVNDMNRTIQRPCQEQDNEDIWTNC